jgi:leucyl-tRNA synthetase
MKLRNELRRFREAGGVGSAAWNEAVDTLLLLAAPLFPHLAEELWTNVRGNAYSVHQQSWPVFDPALLIQDTVQIVVQVNGKVREQAQVPSDVAADQGRVEGLVKALPRVQAALADKSVVKVIYVRGKLINFVVR